MRKYVTADYVIRRSYCIAKQVAYGEKDSAKNIDQLQGIKQTSPHEDTKDLKSGHEPNRLDPKQTVCTGLIFATKLKFEIFYG